MFFILFYFWLSFENLVFSAIKDFVITWHFSGYIVFLQMDKPQFNLSLVIVYLTRMRFYAKMYNPLIDTFHVNPGYILITYS